MKAIVFDTHKFERPHLEAANASHGHELELVDLRLSSQTAHLARGFPAVCAFAHDRLDRTVLEALAAGGTRFLALRSAGFNHVDLAAAGELGLRVARVPAYSPFSVAEHAAALVLGLNRKLCRAAARVRELNFSLDGLVGFDLHGKTVGVVGAGRIGGSFARIMRGFGCEVLAHDPYEDPALVAAGVRYVSWQELLKESHIVSLHLPLSPSSHHIVNADAIAQMRPGVMVINTGRGGLIDTKALIKGLKSGKIGFAGLDVYEEEEEVFFQDLSGTVLQDDMLARLMTFPNVLITAHQGFLTAEALTGIARTTMENLSAFEAGGPLVNEVKSAGR